MNQIFAYMQNIAAIDERQRPVKGIILYAAVPTHFQQDWTLFGYNLRVASIDLSQDWRGIEGSLLSVIESN